MLDLGPFLQLDAGDGAVGEEGRVCWGFLDTINEKLGIGGGKLALRDLGGEVC